MNPYLELLQNIEWLGDDVEQRAVLRSTKAKPKCKSLLFQNVGFNITKNFPLVTTKLVSWKAVAHELIWFLRGETNTKYLKDNKVPIWDAWADENGELGPIYGKQWRRWVCCNEGTIDSVEAVDQIKSLEQGIQEVVDNPGSSKARRLLLLNINPGDMPKESVPTGCHTFAQFIARNGYLHCHVYMRSCDAFLGLPYNIACYAMLTNILAFRAGLRPWKLKFSFGDVHIYENHLEQVQEQLGRMPKELPTLRIQEVVKTLPDLKDLTIDMLSIEGYDPWPKLPGEVAV